MPSSMNDGGPIPYALGSIVSCYEEMGTFFTFISFATPLIILFFTSYTFFMSIYILSYTFGWNLVKL